MNDPKLAVLAAVLVLAAAPVLAQEESDRGCDRCAAPAAEFPPSAYAGPQRAQRSERRAQYARTQTVTRSAYSDGYLNWPGKESGGETSGFGPRYASLPPPCPLVGPGERVISCRYVPLARRDDEADIAPIGGVLYADGGVGPEYIAGGGGGGGGATIIEGGANASSSSSASAQASASAFVSASIVINEHPHNKPPGKGGGYWPPGSMTPPSGGSWPPGSMTPPSGGSWPSGSMPPSGGGMHWGSGGVGGGRAGAHGVAHGHGRR